MKVCSNFYPIKTPHKLLKIRLVTVPRDSLLTYARACGEDDRIVAYYIKRPGFESSCRHAYPKYSSLLLFTYWCVPLDMKYFCVP